jgi:hypothetical protein
MAKYAQGKFNVKNSDKYLGNRSPLYRSSWEFAFMKFCDENPNVIKWASESIKIPYRNPFTGKYTVYVPDFFISYADSNGQQRAELIEIKPSNQTVKERVGNNKNNQAHWILNQAKWEAARAWCKQNGLTFRIINEEDIFHNGRIR